MGGGTSTLVSRDGKSMRLVTPGAFDVDNPASLFGEHVVLGMDDKAGTVYFTASPDNPTQLLPVSRAARRQRRPCSA